MVSNTSVALRPLSASKLIAVRTEVYVPKNPLLHPYLFKEVRKFVTLLVVTFTSGMLWVAYESGRGSDG